MERRSYNFILVFLLFVFQFIFPNYCEIVCLRDTDDRALIAFIGGTDKFDQFCGQNLVTIQQSKAFLAQICGIYLGALFYLRRQDWDCDKVFELELLGQPDACNHFHANLDILYKYLYNVYAGHSDTIVKLKFGSKNNTTNNNYYYLSEIMEYIVSIWEVDLKMKHKLHKDEDDENEIINQKSKNANFVSNLRLLFSGENLETSKIASDNKNDESQRRVKFDEIMEKMSKKAEKIFLTGIPFNYDMTMAVQDEAFVDFVMGKNNLASIVDMHGFAHHSLGYVNNFRMDELEARLVALYLMKGNWDCGKIKKAKLAQECAEWIRPLHILYGYLCTVHAGFPAVKPQFHLNGQNVDLLTAVDTVNNVSKCYFGLNSAEKTTSNQRKKLCEDHSKITLHEIGVQMAIDRLNDDGQQISATDIRKFAQHNFDQYVKKLIEKWIQKALGKKDKLDALEEKIAKNEGLEIEEAKWLYEREKTRWESHCVYGSPFFDIAL